MKAKRRVFHCDPFTFGKCKAAQTLAEILNSGSPKVCEQVSKIFHAATTMFKDLSVLVQKELLMNLYFEHVVKVIDAHDNWDDNVKSHAKNSITAQMIKYRDLYKE